MNTRDTLQKAIEDPPIEERIDILLDEFKMSIRWGRPLIAFAMYRSEYIKKNVLLKLQCSLHSKGKELIQVDINKGLFDIPLVLRDFPRSADRVFSISGLRWGGGRGYSNAYRALNMHRELLIESKALSLFWLTPIEVKQVARHAPDFWAFRDVVVAFLELPSRSEIRVPASRGKPNEAIVEAYLSLLKNEPNNQEILTNIAKIYYALGCYEDAIVYVRKAMRITPKKQDLSLLLAEIYLGLKHPAEAARIQRRINRKGLDQ